MNGNDNLTEYADPEIYDLENQDFEPDGPFLLGFAKRLKGPVLEVGCGTGRITIPLAQNKIDITGLDLVPAMIQQAIRKSGDLKIHWVIADIRYFQLEQTFRLIFETGSVFQHLLTRLDQESYLARVRGHLEDDGRFILGLMFPHPELLTSEESEKDWFQYEDHHGHTIRVSGTEIYDPIQQVKLETAYRRWIDESGEEILKVAPLALRYTFPKEIETLLYYNGFEIVQQYGDWERNQLTNKSRMIISICKKRK
jgi:SAM-dependent methyltransferase